MSSFLGGLLTVVAAVASVVLSGGTTLGLIAGGMLAVSAAAQFGLIGGSLGKFAQSGLFKGLTAAVSLGSAAYAMYGSSALQAGVQADAAAGQAEMTATVGKTLSNDAATIGAENAANAAAFTGKSFLDSAQMGQQVADMAADPALAEVAATTSGVSAESLRNMNQTISNVPGAQGSEAAMQGTNASTVPMVNNGGSAARGLAGPQAAAGAGEGGGMTPGTPAADATIPPAATGSPASPPGSQPGGGYGTDGSAPGAPESWGSRMTGMFGRALDSKGGPAMVGGIGNMLGGIGSGIAQKQAMEDQVRAQQWGNMQWQNKGQVDYAQAAAARPITVPQGYLQRAQQVRTLMAGSQGMQPLPTAQPGAPLAPSPLPQPGH